MEFEVTAIIINNPIPNTIESIDTINCQNVFIEFGMKEDLIKE